MDVSFLNEPHPGLEVRASPLRSGPRKTEVPRTSCAVYRSNSAELQSYLCDNYIDDTIELC